MSNDISVAGGFSQLEVIKLFESIGASNYILETLRNRLKPMLSGQVPRFERANNKSYYEHEDFAINELNTLLLDDKIELVSLMPRVVNPLSVAVQPSKKRLILDATFVKKYVLAPKFKMDSYLLWRRGTICSPGAGVVWSIKK